MIARISYEQHANEKYKAIELDPDYALAYYDRGYTYALLEQWGKALQDYKKATELDSDYAVGYSDRGQVYWNLEQYDKASAE